MFVYKFYENKLSFIMIFILPFFPQKQTIIAEQKGKFTQSFVRNLNNLQKNIASINYKLEGNLLQRTQEFV